MKKILWKDEHLYSKKAKRIFYGMLFVASFAVLLLLGQHIFVYVGVNKVHTLHIGNLEIANKISEKQARLSASIDFLIDKFGSDEEIFAHVGLTKLYVGGYAPNKYTTVSMNINILKHIYKTCEAYNVDPQIIIAMACVESGWNPTARSDKNAIGLLQILPSTARLVRNIKSETELYNPFLNVSIGINWYSILLEKHLGNHNKALTEYYMGVHNKETSKYASKILELADAMDIRGQITEGR